jgi:type II secretory pathway pseudopilin PulG
LVEMLVAVTIGMVVLGGAVTIFMGAVKSEPRTSAKVGAIQEGRVALERITRELRQGIEVEPGASGSGLVLLTYVRSGNCGSSPEGEAEPCQVTYDCAEGQCSRAVAEPDGGAAGTPVQVVTDLSTTANVFTYVPSAESPEYVGVELSFEKTQSTDPTVLADGATLRSGDSS